MDRADVLKIMAVLRGAYPAFYRDISRQEAEDTVNLWTDMFSGDSYHLVAAAVKALIESDSKGYPPHIGAVKEKLRLITGGEEMTEAEAWGIVAKALRNSTYESREEFEKFPPVIKRIVGSPVQLREWGMMDSETVHSVVASNFQRSYKVIAQRERELAKLPPDVKAIVGQLAEERKMEVFPENKDEIPQMEMAERQEDKLAPPPLQLLEAAMRHGTGRSREEVIEALREGDEHDGKIRKTAWGN